MADKPGGYRTKAVATVEAAHDAWENSYLPERGEMATLAMLEAITYALLHVADTIRETRGL